jgi:hypothetical protein
MGNRVAECANRIVGEVLTAASSDRARFGRLPERPDARLGKVDEAPVVLRDDLRPSDGGITMDRERHVHPCLECLEFIEPIPEGHWPAA